MKNKAVSYTRLGVILFVLAALVAGGVYFGVYAGKVKYNINFDDGKQLQKGDRVYFSNIVIGEVSALKLSEAGVVAEINIDKEQSHLLTTDSVFYIETAKTGSRILVKNTRANSPLLTPGQTVQGGVYVGKVKYSITFNDGKQLQKGDRVYFSNVVIGEVSALKLSEAGVVVEIYIDKERRQLLTTDSVFYIETGKTGPRLLVKNTRANSPLLIPGQTVQGVNSFFVWYSLDAVRSLNRINDSEDAKKIHQQIKTFNREVDLLLQDPRYENLDAKGQLLIENLSNSIDEAVESPDAQHAMQIIDEQLFAVQDFLSKIKDNKNVRELRERLDRAYAELVKQAPEN